MLLRTELGRVPSQQLRTLPQLESTVRNVVSFIFGLSDSQVPGVLKPGPTQGSHVLRTVSMDCHIPHAWAFPNPQPGLHHCTPGWPSTWEERGGGSEPVCGFVWTCHGRSRTRANWKHVCAEPQHWAIKRPPEEDSLFPFPCQRRHRNYPKRVGAGKKWQHHNSNKLDQGRRVQHLWRWPADSREQRGSVISNTPSSAKGTHNCLFIDPTVGFCVGESLLLTQNR